MLKLTCLVWLIGQIDKFTIHFLINFDNKRIMIYNSGHLGDGVSNMQSRTFDYLVLGDEMFVHTSPCILWIYFSS